MTLPRLSSVESRLEDPSNGFLLFLEAVDPSRCGRREWFVEHRDPLREALARFGAVFFRGFPGDSHAFEGYLDVLAGDPLSYAGGVSPRSPVHGSVYTATDAPPDLPIVQHHEMSYHPYTPRYIAFFCHTAPEQGGATPLTDGRRVGRLLQAAAPRVMETLEEKGTLFERNYSDANFKGWQATWNTSDRAGLERLLKEHGLEWQWVTEEWLRTRQRLPALVRDPASGDHIVFSCLHLWHREYVAKMNAAMGLPLPPDPAKQPYATFFGDGSPLPEEFVALMRGSYLSQARAIPYRRGDFMVVNNLIATHGREPYRGNRKVYATLRERVPLTDPVFRQPKPSPQEEIRPHG